MENSRLVSIIIPVYNVASCLPVCLDSLIAQTYTNLEIICVDDGSPDECPGILDEYANKDSRIKVVHQKNAGLSAARNRGLDEATGEYVAFVDSDDWLDPNYIKILMHGITRYGANVAACSYAKVQNIGEYHERTDDVVLFRGIIAEELLRNWTLRKTVWGKIYKKSLLCGHRFASEVRMAEDSLFNLDVLCHSDGLKLYYTDIPLYYWYMREDSITHTVDLTRCLDFTRWYAGHPDRKESSEYEWVFRLSAIKFALAARYFALFEENGNETREEANAFLRQLIPDMIHSQYTPKKKKAAHLAMSLMPNVYRVWRLVDDPTMLKAETKRIKRITSKS